MRPVPNHLTANTANQRRLVATVAIVEHRQREQSRRLVRIYRSLRKNPERQSIKIITKWQRLSHGKPQYVCTIESRTVKYQNPF